MTVVYDAGALIAAERDDRAFWADHRVRLEHGVIPIVPTPVVAQVSRSPRQVQLRRLLRGCDVRPLDEADAHRVGLLLAAAGRGDVVDACVATLAVDRTAAVVTSDPVDIRHLLDSAGRNLPIIEV
ncbi:hypothetical protein [Pseudonocardia nigra]|uniref:hypothetical protein n=1 Tax=Pseudonocardia nigra TaxID=1921578 RepID=UPI001C5D12DB|nr:hypothetical protein [Pseudonocardia nigra]